MLTIRKSGGVTDDVSAVPGIILPFPRRRYRNAVAFASTLTPDLAVADQWEMAALTGPVTVNAPVNTTGPAAGLGLLGGSELLFKWLQDATGGRVVTYNAIFLTGGGVAVVTTLSTVTMDYFVWDGTNWRLVSRITGQ
jgi:hypothetical protein